MFGQVQERGCQVADLNTKFGELQVCAQARPFWLRQPASTCQWCLGLWWLNEQKARKLVH